MQRQKDPFCAVCVDMGTTNTRVWLVNGSEIVGRANASVGARDTARDGSDMRVRAALRDLVGKVRALDDVMPSFVVAAGMITSPLGLAEVRHVNAPAGKCEISARIERQDFPDITDLPFFLVPGVATGGIQSDPQAILETDLMRGEETLCMGLIALDLLQSGGTLLNLGSHWKAITVDHNGRISTSITSLSGELIHAAQSQTILASALAQHRPEVLDEQWIEAGMREQRRSGLGRALFCIRLLEQRGFCTPEDRFGFLVGAFIASDLDSLVKRGLLSSETQVVITGGGVVATAWQNSMSNISISSTIIPDCQLELAFLQGLKEIVKCMPAAN